MRVDLTGKVFDRLTVLHRQEGGREWSYWKCRCSCGNSAYVYGELLKAGRTKSCGCLRKEVTIARTTTHGLTESPEYLAFHNMWKRCTSPKHAQYEDYKDRAPPERWKKFENFIEDMGNRPSPNHSLERIKNDLPYGPENCIWATREAQNRNRKSNVWVEYGGRRMILSDWARYLKVDPGSLRYRAKISSMAEAIRYYENALHSSL